jgi:GNAT superfamily N-acetyltransferase
MPFDWFNQVLIERDDATAFDLVAVAGPATAGRDGLVVRMRAGTDDRLVPDLTKAGWIEADARLMTPGMVAFPIDRFAAITLDLPGFEIRQIADVAGLEEHRTVVTDGFGVDRSVAVGTTGLDLLDAPGTLIYVGYADGAPVTSGLGWRSGRSIGVYAISTVPAARRRGYGEAMTARVIADAVAAGCDVAVLQASESGRPIYERLGFRVDVRYDAYVRPLRAE